MMTTRSLLLAGAAILIAAPTVLADQSDYASGIEAIDLQSNIPQINITVRNVAASTDPADRDLRVVSNNPEFTVSGRMQCEVFGPGNYGRAHEMRANFGGNVYLHVTQNGTEVQDMFGYWDGDPQTYSDQYPAADFSIDLEMDLPEAKSGLATFVWHPVDYVEDRLEFFVNNGAGTEADFLRQDDVFNTSLTLNLVGACVYNGSVRGGFEKVSVPINIFYQGDDDIQDVLTTVSGGNTVAAPVDNRARRAVSTRGAETSPPARSSRPARAPRRSDN